MATVLGRTFSGATFAAGGAASIRFQLGNWFRKTKTMDFFPASSTSKEFHLDITANQFRADVLSSATITEIRDISPTVKKLTLQIDDPSFTFKPGQWVDFHITDEKIVGGLSICSTPRMLREKHNIELAAKFSQHPPIFWIHQKCKIGSQVQVRVGGDFFYDPKASDAPCDLLLIAGGVGINPLRSILLHDKDLADEYREKTFGYRPGNAKLLYSAKSVNELLFREDFARISASDNFSCKLYATGARQLQPIDTKFTVEPGRITTLDIVSGFLGPRPFLNIDSVLCYICGPKRMVNDMIPLLQEAGVKPERIIYEAWTSSPDPPAR